MRNSNPFTLSAWSNAILHIDGDAFFASCEQALHPEYKGKCVITGKERNIVSSMSYEAKARGIKRAIPIWQVKKICPDAVILPSDYESYSLFSKRMFSIIRKFTPEVEESSIDEGFADLKGLRRLYRKSYDGIALDIQETIEKELGITVSVGLSVTKTLAKLAAKYKKPHGFTSVPGYKIHLFLKNIPSGDVCGIGSNTEALLKKRNIITAYDYAVAGEHLIKTNLGKTGFELWRELRGEKTYGLNIKEKESYQSVSKAKTFTPPSGEYDYIKAQLFRNAESSCMKLRRHRLRARRVIVFLRYNDYRSAGLQADLSRASYSPMELFSVIDGLLMRIYDSSALYRQTGIVLTKLEADNGVQFELFEDNVRIIAVNRLSKAIDQINKTYGKHTVFAATGLDLAKDKKTLAEKQGRYAVPARKTELLPGETARKRLNIPLWQIKV